MIKTTKSGESQKLQTFKYYLKCFLSTKKKKSANTANKHSKSCPWTINIDPGLLFSYTRTVALSWADRDKVRELVSKSFLRLVDVRNWALTSACKCCHVDRKGILNLRRGKMLIKSLVIIVIFKCELAVCMILRLAYFSLYLFVYLF